MTETDALLGKAREALRSARVLLDADAPESAISRAYYAAYYAASAAVVRAEERPKTHKGLQNRFWSLFVETGYIKPPRADVLRYAWRVREKSDYDAFTRFDAKAAANLVADVAAFVEVVETYLGSASGARFRPRRAPSGDAEPPEAPPPPEAPLPSGGGRPV